MRERVQRSAYILWPAKRFVSQSEATHLRLLPWPSSTGNKPHRRHQRHRATDRAIWRWVSRLPSSPNPVLCAGAAAPPLSEISLSLLSVLCSYSYLQSQRPFWAQKKRWSLVRENQQSSAHNFVKDFSSLFPESYAAALWKRALTAKIPWIWKNRGSKPLPSVISSMELPKNFENKKLPNTLKWLAFSPFHL